LRISLCEPGSWSDRCAARLPLDDVPFLAISAVLVGVATRGARANAGFLRVRTPQA
jgi:hypothetical protein